MKYHSHEYKIDSTQSNKHKHTAKGYCESMIGIGYFHIHLFYGVSSYDNHTHYFSGFTGFPIKTHNGHVHKINETLKRSNMHKHNIVGYTAENISYNYYGEKKIKHKRWGLQCATLQKI